MGEIRKKHMIKHLKKMREFFDNIQSPYVETAPRASELIKICSKFISSTKKISYTNELYKLN
ncbi:hypothetical protein GCM10020331_077970 [Ectobacillus funiculus]